MSEWTLNKEHCSVLKAFFLKHSCGANLGKWVIGVRGKCYKCGHKIPDEFVAVARIALHKYYPGKVEIEFGSE